MPEGNIIYRQSAQVISQITDLSQIYSQPDWSFFACVTASKGELNHPYLIDAGDLNVLESYLGKVTPEHTGLMAAARAVRGGAPCYLVRVAGASVKSSEIAVKDDAGTDQLKFFIKQKGTDGDAYTANIIRNPGLGETDENTQTIQMRPAGPAAPDNPNFDYPTAYAAAGVSLKGTVIRYDTSAVVPVIAPELLHGENAYMGIVFPKPTGATKVTCAINGSVVSAEVDLTTEGDEVLNGEYITYFGFADSTGKPLADSKWDVALTWTTPDGVTTTNVTIYRANGPEVPTYKLTLLRDNVAVDEFEFSTVEDSEDYVLDIENSLVGVEAIGDVNGVTLATGTFAFAGGNDGTADITAQDYIGSDATGNYTGVYCFLDKAMRGQLIATLGMSDKNYILAMKEVADRRKDLTVVIDTPAGLTKTQAEQWRNGTGAYADDPLLAGFNMEVYWDWLKDVWDDQEVVIPPSSYVCENSVLSFETNGTWWPVAGDERGVISATGVVTKIDEVTDRDELVTNNINPIHDTGTRGIQIYGNETLNEEYSDLSAAHIARTLTYIRSTIDEYTETLKFELNDDILWSTWVDHVQDKILEPIRARQGLKWFRATMGESTTTPEELSERIVRGVVELQFVPDAEIFIIDYVVYASSAEIE